MYLIFFYGSFHAVSNLETKWNIIFSISYIRNAICLVEYFFKKMY